MRMLIDDDDSSVVELFAQAAKSRGIEEIDTANTGEEALSRVIGATYDLITLDIRMLGCVGANPQYVLSVLRGQWLAQLS
jgi:CheY-like chemotaxis protein